MTEQQLYTIIRKYIDHDSSCGVVNMWSEYDHCTCGLKDAIKQAAKAIKKKLDEEK